MQAVLFLLDHFTDPVHSTAMQKLHHKGGKEYFKLRVAARENAYGFIPSSKHVLETQMFTRSSPNKYIWCLIPSGYSEAAKDLSVPYCSGDLNIVLV